MDALSKDRQSLIYGFIGVLIFSLTLPASRMAVSQLDPIFVGLGRAVVAAVLAMICLRYARATWPTRRQWLRLLAVASGVVIGFPVLSAIAMRHVDAAHGSVFVGLMPLITAIFGSWLSGERANLRFWLASLGGSATIAAFALLGGQGGWQLADLLMLGAVVMGGFGYAEGARLSKELGAWQTICWALIAALPFVIWPAYTQLPADISALQPSTLLAFAYISVFSMFLGFFAWYRGLAMGGTMRVAQLQMLQPFLSLIASAILLGEHISGSQIAAATLVLLFVHLARKSLPIAKASAPVARPMPRAASAIASSTA